MSKKTLLLEIITLVSCLFLIVYVVIGARHVSAADARDDVRVHDMGVLLEAINQYHNDFGYYPSVTDGASALSKGPVTCSDGTLGTASWCGLIAALRPYLHEQIADPVSDGLYAYYYNAVGEHPRYFGLMTMLESVRNTTLADEDGGQFCTTCGQGKRYRGYELGTAPQYCAWSNPDRNWTTGKNDEVCGP